MLRMQRRNEKTCLKNQIYYYYYYYSFLLPSFFYSPIDTTLSGIVAIRYPQQFLLK